MGLLFMDGCDNYAANTDITDRWSSVAATGSPNWTVQTSGGVDGGGALQCEDDDVDLVKRVRAVGTTGETQIRIAFWFKSSAAPSVSSDDIVQIWIADTDNGNGNVNIKVTTSGLINISDYGSSTTHGNSSTNVCDDEWHFIEINVVIDGSSGTHELWVDGNKEIDFSGDTYFTGTISTNVVAFNTPEADGIIDDIIIWDDNDTGDGFTGALGGVYRIETIRPNANGDDSDFVGSDADSTDNYQLVDEAVLDTSDYVGSGTDTESDLYGFGSLGSTPSEIKAVVVSAHVALDTAGDENFRLNAKSGTSTGNGSDRNSQATAYALYQQAFSVDPDTSSAWDASGVNAAQFGIEKRA